MSRLLILLAGLAAMFLTWNIVERIKVEAAASTSAPTAIVVDDPANYWVEHGFVPLEPPIRVSVVPGSETVIFVRIPEGGRASTHFLPSQGRYTITLPPGSAADRVSYSRRPDGSRVVDDVRGTRWDDNGTEFFHVYHPTSDLPNAPLAGFEWLRRDLQQQEDATEQLITLIRSTGERYPWLRASRRDLARFRRLNNCSLCHTADKPAAQTGDDSLPPWPTDGLGLYVPLAVLEDSAPLSASSFFDDPNAGDPFVSVRCRFGEAALHQSASSRWFTCSDGSAPMGYYDLGRALLSGDDHSHRVCTTRRYLFDRLDELGQEVFRRAMRACNGI